MNNKENSVFENNIEEEDILDIDEDDDELPEEDIEYEEDLLNDLEDGHIEEEKDDILDDLDDLINDIEEEETETEEKITEKRTTFPILTKYEKNFVLGFRTQQIINGSVILIDINKLKEKSAYNIALQELAEKKIPLKIKRTLPNGKVEIWDLEDLIVL